MGNNCSCIGYIACALGIGVLIASIFPPIFVVLVLAVVVIVISIMCLKK